MERGNVREREEAMDIWRESVEGREMIDLLY